MRGRDWCSREARLSARRTCVQRSLTLLVLVGVVGVLAPAALADTASLNPVADTFVQAGQPGVTYGTELVFDVYGGKSLYPCPTVNGDPCTQGPAYGLLRFDLSSLPALSTITGVQLKLGQTQGFAEDGEQHHMLMFLDNDSWTEAGTSWNNRPTDGFGVTPPYISPVPTFPALLAPNQLGSALIDVQFPFQNLVKTYTFPSSDDDIKTAAQAEVDFVARVQAELNDDRLLSLEVFNPNCPAGAGPRDCNLHPDSGYWARYNSREAPLVVQRPELMVTYTTAASGTPQSGPTFTVNTDADGAPADVGCTTTDCTLREAMDAANARAGANTIAFDIPGAGPHLITAASNLPDTGSVTIDGTSQPGYAGTPLVEVRGSGGISQAFFGAGNDVTVKGLSITDWGLGVALLGSGGVEDSWFGVEPGGALRPNTLGVALEGTGATVVRSRIAGGMCGVLVTGTQTEACGSSNGDAQDGVGNTVGGSSANGNVIWGQTDASVRVSDAGGGNVIAGNAIGVPPAGFSASTSTAGVDVSGTIGTIIGDSAVIGDSSANTDRGNVIGSSTSGIRLGSSAVGTRIAGNFVGANRLGTALATPNTSGVSAVAGSSGSRIGPFNVIAFNTGTGVAIGAGSGHRVAANRITGNGNQGISISPGANGNLLPPVLSPVAVQAGGATTVNGTLTGTPLTLYYVEFFVNATCDGSGSGEGDTYIFYTPATTDGNGAASFSFVTPAGALGQAITATATSAFTADTSAFSNCAAISTGAPTPTLIRAVPTGSFTTVAGRVDGGGTSAALSFYSSPTCSGGVLGASPQAIGAVTAPLDANGYFSVGVANVPLLSFVAAKATGGAELSPCIVAKAANDSWPTAFPIDSVSGQTSPDVLDSLGQSRWYSFAIRPGSKVTVNLTGLPADYDLAVFKDIRQAYTALTSAADLTRLSAEYAPSVFSPSVFSPSVFSPSVFSPDAYSPSVFSPSVFSPSVFSPSVFSPSVFSPSVFSPSVFSPSVFSPSVFSPSVFSPSVFSPSVFSPSVFSPDAFASAQTRSLVAVSATPGTADELVVANTWTNTGRYYVRVSGRGGAFSTDSPFHVTVTNGASSCPTGIGPIGSAPAAAAAGAFKTIILTDPARLPGNAADKAALQAKLVTFAGRTEVAGKIVDLSADSRIVSLNAQADANRACPYAKNLVANAIKDIVDSYRAANPALAYVSIIGGDNVVPFFRYPDESLLGQESGYIPPVGSATASEASLRLDYVLGQDAYGARTQVSLRSSAVPVPDLAVGRLVETASEAAGMIDAYTATNGQVTPTSSLVTGYDFLADAATAVKGDLAAGTGATVDELIAPNNISPQDPSAWTATQLKSKLLGSARHDIVFLAGHFSANSTLAADFSTSLLTTDLAASTTNLQNTIVFSAGCHSGYNIVDGDVVPNVTLPLDWAQAFAQKGTTLIGGTGYQYGDTDFLEYSERIYAGFAAQLRTGTGLVTVGDALNRAKQQYLERTPDIRGIHQKALLEATVFGLPMLAVNMPGARLPAAGNASIVTTLTPFGADPGLTLGLRTADVAITPTLSPISVVLKNLSGPSLSATYYRGTGGVVTNPAEPALPLEVRDITPPDGSKVLRGVGFRSGTYADSTVVPLTGAPTTELRGVHSPFVSPVFFPMRLVTPNYFSSLGAGGRTKLLITPAQHQAADIAAGTSTLRLYSDMGLRLFYSGFLGTAAASAAPDITAVEAVPDGAGGVSFTVHAVGNPAAGMQQVWITYTGHGPSRWESLDLTQDPVDSTLWKGTLPAISTPANLRFIVQAANGLGLVSLDDALGAYFRVAGVSTTPPTETTLTLQSPPTSAVFGDTKTVTAKLLPAGGSLQGASVIISIGSSSRVGTTDANGMATVSIPVVSTPGSTQVTASYAGDDAHEPAGDTAPFTVSKAPSSLSAFATVPVLAANGTTLLTTLTAAFGGNTQPLLQQTVTYALTGPSGAKTYSAITDYLGRAPLSPAGLAPGTYNVTASFAGDATYTQATRTGTLVVFWPFVVFASARTGSGDIYTVDTRGGAPVQVTSGTAIDAEPVWSPDRRKIAFTSTRDGNVEIYVMNADGSGVKRLTTQSSVDASPAWSPDGTKIAFSSNRTSGNWDIFAMDAVTGANVTRLTTDTGADTFPAWSPTGTKIAFSSTRSGAGDIYAMNANGTSQIRLTTSAAIDTEPDWFGSTIAFSTNRDGVLNFEIYTMTDSGGSQTRRTTESRPDTSPAWSPDGTKIAFASNRPGGVNFDIYTMNANGASPAALAASSAVDLFPDW